MGFELGYIECAVWSSTDDAGKPWDQSDAEFSPEALVRFRADCDKFWPEYLRTLTEQGYEDDSQLRALPDDSRVGHDFWLTRNGHGAGFWDGYYPKALGEALTKLAKSYGECNLYIGDDGLIYCM